MSPPAAPLTPAPATTPPASSPAAAPGGAATIAPEDQTREQLERVFSPEISEMLLTAAFGVAAVATGEPDIWQLDPDEAEPLAPALGRQLARIPIVRAVGPDNTEAGIVVLGIGVMVTRRLNEHARKRQRERSDREAELRGGERRSERGPVELETERARRRSPAAARGAELEDGSASAHFGIRS